MSEPKPLKWFRLYPEIVNDDKVRLLAFEDRWHYVAILCMKAGGVLDEPDEELRWQRVRVNLGLATADMEKMLDRLAKVKLIDRETLEPLAWSKRQFVSDQDPTAGERLKRFREKKKGETEVQRVSVTLRNAHETPSETETETETEEKKKRAVARIARPEGVSEQTWQDFQATRKAHRAPLTPTALRGIESEAKKAGMALEDVLLLCCQRGWRGFQADWVAAESTASPQKPRAAAGWTSSDDGIANRARELGIPLSKWPRTYAELKQMCFDAERAMKVAA